MNNYPDKIDFDKERDVGQILNVTFTFVRQNYKNLLNLVLLRAGLFILLSTVFFLVTFQISGFSTQQLFTKEGGGLVLFFLIASLVSIFLGLYINASIYEYILHYQKFGLNNFSLNLVNKSSLKHILPLFGLYFVFFLICLIGYILCILPGVFLSVQFSLAGIILVIEKTDIWSAFQRNRYLLTTGSEDFSFNKWASVFVLALILGIMQYAISYGLMIPFYSGIFFVELLSQKGDKIANNSWFLYLGIFWGLVYYTAMSVLYMINLVAYTFLYYSLLEQKDSKGLLNRIGLIGVQSSLHQSTSPDEEESY